MQQLDPDILKRYHSAMALKATSSQKGRVDEDIRSRSRGLLQTYSRRRRRGFCDSARAWTQRMYPDTVLEARDIFFKVFFFRLTCFVSVG